MIISFANFIIELFISSSPIRKLPSKYREHQNTNCPNISWGTAIFLLQHNFWSHVARSSTKYFYLFVVRDASGEPIVDDFDVILFIQKQIFEFDVSVSDASAVAIFQPFDNLSYNFLRIVFLQATFLFRFQITVQ